MKLDLSQEILEKKAQTLNFTNICLVGAELFHVDGQTNMMKILAAFRSSANAPKNR
jgi:hypothetical protein